MGKGRKSGKSTGYAERFLHGRTKDEIAEIQDKVIAADRDEQAKRRTKRPQ